MHATTVMAVAVQPRNHRTVGIVQLRMDRPSRSDTPGVLRVLFDAHYAAVLAYARRRCNGLADAEEVVADTFVVAWRRVDDLPPEPGERLPWLYGIARRVLLNQRRGNQRRARLLERVRTVAVSDSGRPPAMASVMDAMARLTETDREILRLVAWEGLSHAEVAAVLGVSVNAAAIRLHRARTRLAHVMREPKPTAKGSARIRTWLGWKGSTRSLSEREEAR